MRFIIPLGVVVLLIAVLAIGLKLDPRLIPSPLIGKPAPAFELPLLDDSGRSIDKSALYGRPVVVNYFASWCAACRDEHPLLMELSKQGIELIGVAYKDAPEDSRRWLARHGNPYRQIMVDRLGQTGLDWGVYGIPETYVLDAEGLIAFKHVGALTEQVWAEEILPRLTPGEQPE